MRLTVFSSKTCWPSKSAPSGYATDGGFALQMRTLSELFDATRVVVPVEVRGEQPGEIPIGGRNLEVVPLTSPGGVGLRRKIALAPWLARNGRTVMREVLGAEAVHVPVPADLGTFGMVLGYALRKPLFVRYCGNWTRQKTAAERFWKWFMESAAGGRNVMFATGGAAEAPSRNANVRWIFSTTLTDRELRTCWRPRALRPGSARLITVARQEQGKGTDILIRSLPRVAAEFPEAALAVVGDGRAVQGLKELALSLGLAGRVVFYGKLTHEQVIERLHEADLFCYPTASEGFPKAVLEALACGLPVVTTAVSVLPKLIGGGAGILLEERSERAVAEAIGGCLADARQYGEMSRAALERAREYSLERWRDSIGDTLRGAWGPLASHG